MKKLTSFIHHHNSKASTLDVILHGGSGGMSTPFLQKVFKSSRDKGNSVIMFNFPFFERAENCSSGPKLKEELEAIGQMLSIARCEKYSCVRLIGKSLGGIVASYFLRDLSAKEKNTYEIIVLGYVTGSTKLNNFEGKIAIIQGENDKFGDIEAVKKDMRKAMSKKIEFHQIANADHSYRDPETKKPIYEGGAIEILKNL